MADVADLLDKLDKQVVLAIVARLTHRSPPTANLAVEGITDHPNGESQTAIKPACTPGFLAKSIPCSGQIIAINQSLPNSSRTTTSSEAVLGRTGTSKASTPAFAMSCSTARSSTVCARPSSSSSHD